MGFSNGVRLFPPVARIGSVSIISGVFKILYPLSLGLVFGTAFLGEFSLLYHAILLTALPIEVGLSFAILTFIREEETGIVYSTSFLISVTYALVSGLVMASSLPVPPFYFLTGLFFYSLHIFHRYFLWGRGEVSKVLKFELIGFVTALFSLPILVEVTDGFQLILFPLIYNVVFSFSTLNQWLEFFSLKSINKRFMINLLRYSSFLLISNGLGLGLIYLQYFVATIIFGATVVGLLTFINLIFSPLSFFSFPLAVFFLSAKTSFRETYSSLVENIDVVIMTAGILPIFLWRFFSVFREPIFFVFAFLIYLSNLLLVSNSLKAIHFLRDPSIAYIVPYSSIMGFLSTFGSWIFLIWIPNLLFVALGLVVGNSVVNLVFTRKLWKVGIRPYFAIVTNFGFIFISLTVSIIY